MELEIKLAEKIIYTDGCFTRKIMWFSGWNRELAQKYKKRGATIRFIHGLTGKETEVKLDEIKPNIIFDYN